MTIPTAIIIGIFAVFALVWAEMEKNK